MKFGFDWPAVSEKKIIEYYGNILVNCPGVAADQPLGSKFFSESYIVSPYAHFLQVFFLQVFPFK